MIGSEQLSSSDVEISVEGPESERPLRMLDGRHARAAAEPEELNSLQPGPKRRGTTALPTNLCWPHDKRHSA